MSKNVISQLIKAREAIQPPKKKALTHTSAASTSRSKDA